ncbi:MAG: HEPN domain-containing protein [Gammaproteobacteria bacterium]|nr:HEPN domain-containing protein [Gammaproteobacteria bacterium]
MRILEVDSAIDRCREHLQCCGSQKEHIEAYLTQYLLVLIYANFEKKIKEIITDKLACTCNMLVKSYIEPSVDDAIKKISMEELKKFVARRFGKPHRDKIKKDSSLTLQVEIYYGNIINNRHMTSHGSGSSMTFLDLVNFYEEAHKVLDALSNI